MTPSGEPQPHEAVLLEEAVELLISDDSGFYVDATFGRGGHSKKILASLSNEARLLVIDKDPLAIGVAKGLGKSDDRLAYAHGSFADVDKYIAEMGVQGVEGVLADLGVSSPQLDDADRGFSFIDDGPLDMRMNTESGMSAAEWLVSAPEAEISTVLKEFGEERFAKRIARAIVEERVERPITTTAQLAKVVAEANPSWEKNKHPATRAFQAIRIKVNNELADLQRFLEVTVQCLAVGGRLVVISFHSLEDRMVKQFMREKTKGNAPPVGVPVFDRDIVKNFRVLGKKVKPGREEVERNIRSRSAVMRVLEKISDD